MIAIFKFSSALLNTRIFGKIETCVENNCPPLIFFFYQSECHGDNSSCGISSPGRGGRYSMRNGSHHLVGSYVSHSRTSKIWSHDSWHDTGDWETNPNGHADCSHDRNVGRRILEEQDGNSGVDWISHQRREFSVIFEESKLQKLLWGILSLFNLLCYQLLKTRGTASVFWIMIPIHLIYNFHLLTGKLMEKIWRKNIKISSFFFFFLLKDPTV